MDLVAHFYTRDNYNAARANEKAATVRSLHVAAASVPGIIIIVISCMRG